MDKQVRLNPKLHSAGSRLLISSRWWSSFGDLFEVIVVEWSKGGRVKIKYASGTSSWEGGRWLDEHSVVEVLPKSMEKKP